MRRLLLTGLFFVIGCGALGSHLNVDGGSGSSGRDGSTGGGGGTLGGGTGGGGGLGGGFGGGGGGGDFDAGWPTTQLAADAFIETAYPGLYGYLETLPLVAWHGRVFVNPSNGKLVEFRDGAWQTVTSSLDFGVTALRAWPDEVVVMAAHQTTCGAACLDGGATSSRIDIGAAINVVCRGEGPLTFENSYGEFGSYRDGGWHSRSKPFENFIGPGTPCWSATDGTILYGGQRVIRIGLDGGSHFETPRSDTEQFTDFVQTRFGLVAIGAAQRVFVATDAGWQLVSQRGQTLTPDVWFRALPLPDGRFIAVGVKSLSVVSEGKVEAWPYPRGQLQTNGEAIDVAADGTVWVAGRFQPPGNTDPDDKVVGYRLR